MKCFKRAFNSNEQKNSLNEHKNSSKEFIKIVQMNKKFQMNIKIVQTNNLSLKFK